MTDKELLNDKLRSKIAMPIGDVLSDSFDLFGKGAGKYIGFTFLMFLMLVAVGIITVVVPYIGVVLFALIALVAAPALQVGIGRFTKKLKEDKNPQFSDFFSGFQYNLGQLVLQGFVITLISFAIAFGLNTDLYLAYFDMGLAYDGDFEELATQITEINELYNQTTVLSLLGTLFSYYIALGLCLTPYIVSFYKVNAFTAMDISFRTINKVVFNAVAIQFVLGVIAVMGAIVILIGLFATLPIAFIGSYLMFRYAIGEKDSMEADEFGINEHLQ
jgi:hypothetical protein